VGSRYQEVTALTGEDRKAKMLERVRALLAKANGTNFPEEADAFRAKADEIMTAYAIEQWQVDAAQDGVNARPTPERRDLDMSWFRQTPFKDQLWWIFTDLAQHCRCRVVVSKTWYDNEHVRRIPVLGLPSDLDYFDMLFTHVMFDFSRKIDPKPDPVRLSYEENLAMLKEAGLGWPEICRLMVDCGQLEYLETAPAREGALPHPRPWMVRKNYAKPAHDYRRWCKKEGRPQSYTDPRTYRRNFADGYSDGLDVKLKKMRRDQEGAYDKDHEAGSMALVVRDIRQVIKDLMYDIWPDLKPHEPDCQCARCVREREAKLKPVKYKPDTRKTDWAARSAGEQAGREVDLAAHQGRRVGQRRAIER
jgi:hypothetical protein